MKHTSNHNEMPDEAAMGEVGHFLRQWQAPEADPDAKARLIALLARAQMRPANTAPVLARSALKMSLRWAWLILRAQTRLIHRVMWVASALLLALGTLVTLISYQTPNGTTLPIILIAPVVAAVGVAFLYGEDVDPPLELQMTTPVSPRLILLARLALLFGFNLALALAGSLVLAAARAEISLLPLVLSWLAPMTFLSALAFLLGVLLFDTTLSIIISIAAWFVLVWRHFGDLTVMPYAAYLPDLLAVDLRLTLFAVAPLLVLVALWLSARESRFSNTSG